MRISETGLDLIRFFEGLRTAAYQDSVGVWTIGYGSTGPHVTPGLAITAEEAEDLLRHDVARFEEGVDEAVKVTLSQDEFDSLVAFSFNVGMGAFRQSTLLRKLNGGDFDGAANEFKRWDKAGGRALPGLTRRREAEARLFQGMEWR